MKLKKGSKQAKEFMAKLRAKKKRKSSVSGLERVNKRKTTTYVHYTRSKPIKKAPKKTTARKSSAKRIEKRTSIALSSLNIGDTFTVGTSSKIHCS